MYDSESNGYERILEMFDDVVSSLFSAILNSIRYLRRKMRLMTLTSTRRQEISSLHRSAYANRKTLHDLDVLPCQGRCSEIQGIHWAFFCGGYEIEVSWWGGIGTNEEIKANLLKGLSEENKFVQDQVYIYIYFFFRKSSIGHRIEGFVWRREGEKGPSVIHPTIWRKRL